MHPRDLETLAGEVAVKLWSLPGVEIDSLIGPNQGGDPELSRMFPRDYGDVLRQLKALTEAQLLSAHAKYVGSPFIETPVPWEPRMFRLFISHIAKSRARLADVKKELRGYGIDGFLAHESIQPTAQWQNIIEGALRTCDALVAFFEPGFHESQWTDQEIGAVLGREKLVVPVDIGAVPYGFIGRYQAVPGRNMTEEELAEAVFDSILRDGQASVGLTRALAYQLEDSESFAAARRNVGLLERAPVIAADDCDLLELAGQRNNQVEGSWGVTDRINKLVTKFRPPVP